MKILVTGGGGFIGSHVVDRLVQKGHDVVVLDNLDSQVHGETNGVPRNITEPVRSGLVEFIHGDVRSPDDVARALDGVQAVAHLAAAVGVGQSMYEPHYYTSTNVDGQGVLHEAIAKDPERIQRFVVASSMSNYGEGAYVCTACGPHAPAPRPADQLEAGTLDVLCPDCGAPLEPVPTPESKPLQHTSIYSITKKTQEEMALCFGAAYRIPTLALRFFNVYGSRQSLSNPYTGVAAIFMSRLMNGNAPLIFEDGHQSRDFIHVSDVASAVVRSLEAPPEAEGVLNVATGRRTSILDVARSLARVLGLAIEPVIDGRYRAGDIRHCFGDPTRAREVLGFEAATTLDAGMRELIQWSEREDATDRVASAVTELERQGLVR